VNRYKQAARRPQRRFGECIASIVRAEEQTKQETRYKQAASKPQRRFGECTGSIVKVEEQTKQETNNE
jgi:hypothetical protein